MPSIDLMASVLQHKKAPKVQSGNEWAEPAVKPPPPTSMWGSGSHLLRGPHVRARVCGCAQSTGREDCYLNRVEPKLLLEPKFIKQEGKGNCSCNIKPEQQSKLVAKQTFLLPFIIFERE